MTSQQVLRQKPVGGNNFLSVISTDKQSLLYPTAELGSQLILDWYGAVPTLVGFEMVEQQWVDLKPPKKTHRYDEKESKVLWNSIYPLSDFCWFLLFLSHFDVPDEKGNTIKQR